MATLPTNYQDATALLGTLTELPATTSRGLNAINTQINTNTTDIGVNAANIASHTATLAGHTAAIAANTTVVNATTYGLVGDGTADDTAALQNAINAAGATLGPADVFLPIGTFSCTGLTGASSMRIVGQGKTKSIIKVRSGTSATKLLNLSGCTNVTIEGVGFDGNNNTTCLSGVYVATNGGIKSLALRNCGFSNFMPVAQLSNVHAALYMWTSSGLYVDSCTFTNNGRAISAQSPDGEVSVNRCTVTASTGRMATGISVSEAGSAVTNAKVRFTNNYVDTADADASLVGAEGHGISVLKVHGVIITGNVCLNSGRGILVSGQGFGAIVSNNLCHHNIDAGIRVEPEISSTDVTVGTAGVPRGCIIANNVCHTNGAVFGGSHWGVGITASYAAGTMMANNICHDNWQWGIAVDSDRVQLFGNITYNNCTDATFNPASAGHGNRAGIVNYAGSNCVFIGNTAFDNQTSKTQNYGLSVSNNLTPVVLGNSFSGNATADIDNPDQISLTTVGLLTTAASTTGIAGIRLPHGAAPTSPVNGDMWTTTAGLFVRINGVTKTVTLT